MCVREISRSKTKRTNIYKSEQNNQDKYANDEATMQGVRCKGHRELIGVHDLELRD